jgi:hypothetical protein
MSDTQGGRPARPAGGARGRVGEQERTEATQPVAASAQRRTQVLAPGGSGTSARGVRRLVRRRATVRRVDPWSVLKLSLIFYLCVLAVAMLVLTMFWAIVNRIGLLDTMLGFLAELQLEVEVNGGNIARAAFLLGLLNVVLFSGVNVFLAFLYNLVADLIGGLKIVLAEEE